jgi:phospholipid/cholesterol/gamma-HCH transport system ATP-binding protein
VLIKHLVGLLEPDEADVLIDGRERGRKTAHERHDVRTRMGV